MDGVFLSMMPIVDAVDQDGAMAVAVDRFFGHQYKAVNILKTGNFYHPHMPDEMLSITEETLDQLIANFETDLSRGQERPVDFNHLMETADTPENGRAAGWIKKLFKADGRLYALTEFTDEATGLIKDKKYRYTSSSYLLDAIDIETRERVGNKLKSYAITNTPHIQGLEPVELREYVAPKPSEAFAQSEPSQSIDTKEGVNKMELAEKLQSESVELRAELEMKDSAINAAKVELKEACELLDKANEEAVQLREAAQKSAEKMGELEKINADLLHSDAERQVELKILTGYARKEQKDVLVEVALSNPAAFAELTKHKVVDLAEYGVAGVKDEDGAIDFVDLCKQVQKEKGIGFTEAARMVAAQNPRLTFAHMQKRSK